MVEKPTTTTTTSCFLPISGYFLGSTGEQWNQCYSLSTGECNLGALEPSGSQNKQKEHVACGLGAIVRVDCSLLCVKWILEWEQQELEPKKER